MFIVLLLFLLFGSRSIAGLLIEAEWWKELGQYETWISQLYYSLAPGAVVTVLLFVVLWVGHAAGIRSARARLSEMPGYARLASLGLLALSVLMALVITDGGVILRYFGGRGTGTAYHDPVFGHSLGFYFFELPFFEWTLSVLIALSIATIAVYWLAARGVALRDRISDFRSGSQVELNPEDFRLDRLLESKVILVAASLGLLALGARHFFSRYELLTSDHGFMVGVDWVAQNVTLPLKMAAAGACGLAALLLILRRWQWAVLLVAAAQVVPGLVSAAVNSLYVRPNEISIQRAYIERHIKNTRSAYRMAESVKEVDFAPSASASIDPNKHRDLLSNIRLWDWRAFHDTVTQIQALRTYYVFQDSDVDRYRLTGADGKQRLQQVLVTPRELDVRQLPDARTRWINPHFIYTHGYGVVMAEANRLTPDGLPIPIIQNAPPEIRTPDLKLTRPELYYGEVVHEPVFVRTGQPEFNYPSGAENVHSRYEGSGGFPISSPFLRLAAAMREGDWNILLTGNLAPESRMMIRRNVRERLQALASFIDWDEDPYLVVTPEGRLVWLVDGYTTSAAHPYSRKLRTRHFGVINYIRNSVKAAVDAYDGSARIYVFDGEEPITAAYRRLFPRLFVDAAEMPAGLADHVRYPESIFMIQAELYRSFHMKDPEAFYNKEDLWDVARTLASQEGEAASAEPTYVLAQLPGEAEPEFVLTIPFTPRNKDNLIGLLMARCDRGKLGQMVVYEMSKQALVFGPMQIKARINQDQNISKDLTLWNQQGSKVIRGQMIVLPVENTFLYMEPIYLQASQAPMPQLKKIALAAGNRIAYADTYDEALAQLTGGTTAEPAQQPGTQPAPAAQAQQPVADGGDARMTQARRLLQRYRELMAQGKFAEAGQELERLQRLLQ